MTHDKRKQKALDDEWKAKLKALDDDRPGRGGKR
jgi:hypothetical protein